VVRWISEWKSIACGSFSKNDSGGVRSRITSLSKLPLNPPTLVKGVVELALADQLVHQAKQHLADTSSDGSGGQLFPLNPKLLLTKLHLLGKQFSLNHH
jgi:hypothetical protein